MVYGNYRVVRKGDGRPGQVARVWIGVAGEARSAMGDVGVYASSGPRVRMSECVPLTVQLFSRLTASIRHAGPMAR